MKILKWVGIILFTLIVLIVINGLSHSSYEFKVERTINRPLNFAFAEFNKTETMGEWLEGFVRIESIAGSENAVGSKYKLYFKDPYGGDIEMIETVTDFKENELLAFDLENEDVFAHNEIEFTSIDSTSCKVNSSQLFQPKAFMIKIMMPFFESSTIERNERNFEALKNYIEGKAIPVDSAQVEKIE